MLKQQPCQSLEAISGCQKPLLLSIQSCCHLHSIAFLHCQNKADSLPCNLETAKQVPSSGLHGLGSHKLGMTRRLSSHALHDNVHGGSQQHISTHSNLFCSNHMELSLFHHSISNNSRKQPFLSLAKLSSRSCSMGQGGACSPALILAVNSQDKVPTYITQSCCRRLKVCMGLLQKAIPVHQKLLLQARAFTRIKCHLLNGAPQSHTLQRNLCTAPIRLDSVCHQSTTWHLGRQEYLFSKQLKLHGSIHHHDMLAVLLFMRLG